MDHQLIAQIYTAGVDPARFEDLLNVWADKIVANHVLGEPAALDRPEIVAHIRQALFVLDGMDSETGSADGGDDDRWTSSPYAVLLCDGQGRIHGANPAARSRYSVQHVAELPFDADAIEAILRQASRLANGPGTPAVIVARNRSLDQRTVLSLQYHANRTAAGGSGERVRLTSNELHWPNELNRILQSTFGLSTAECAVMQLMAEGASVAKVAEQRGSSVATVRVQVRSIYDKTGVRSQPELLRLAISFASLFHRSGPTGADGDDGLEPSHHPTAAERHLLMLPDGRRLDYSDLGDPRGHPVVFLHDEYYGDCWARETVASATARGLRIITPARAHYGRSDGYPLGVETTEQFASDLEVLLHHIGISRFTLLARRTGFRFAVEVGHRMGDRVTGAVALSPGLPAQSAEDYRHMTRLARFISLAVFKNPALLELVCKAGIRYFRQMGPKKLAQLLNRGCAEDLAVLEDPRQWALIRRGMEFSSVNGYLGYIHDVAHDPVRAWRRTVSCPVHIRCLIGARDPHDRARRAQRCIDAGADLSVALVEGAGQLFFYAHARHVLDELRAVNAGTL